MYAVNIGVKYVLLLPQSGTFRWKAVLGCMAWIDTVAVYTVLSAHTSWYKCLATIYHCKNKVGCFENEKRCRDGMPKITQLSCLHVLNARGDSLTDVLRVVSIVIVVMHYVSFQYQSITTVCLSTTRVTRVTTLWLKQPTCFCSD